MTDVPRELFDKGRPTKPRVMTAAEVYRRSHEKAVVQGGVAILSHFMLCQDLNLLDDVVPRVLNVTAAIQKT